MEARLGPTGRGASLVPRLVLLLTAIFLPTLAVYFVYNKSVMEALHAREVDDTVHRASFRMEEILGGYDLAWMVTGVVMTDVAERERREAERLRLDRDLRRVLADFPGLKGISVFAVAEGGLTFAAGCGGCSTNPSGEDIEGKTVRIEMQRGTEHVLAVSVPVRRWNAADHRDELAAAVHLEISPEKVGVRFPDWQRGLLLGAIGTMLVLGLSVAFFMRRAVRLPAIELMDAMRSAAEGNLAALVEPRTGEMGQLAGSYNQMMRRLKQSMDENHKLLAQIQGFNEELKRQVAAAIAELGSRNTELAEANEKLFLIQRQMTTLEKLATLGQLATTIAHELGTPLNAISGHLQLLAEEEVGARARERLRVIDQQVDRLIGIVRDVLKSMRVPPPRLEPTDVNRVIEGVLALVEPVTAKRGIKVELKLSRDVPQVPGDADQIEQVLMNLFTNAMDAMDRGGTLSVATAFVSAEDAARLSADWQSQPTGSYATLPDGSYLRLDVSDTGAGMDEETARNAFEPFYSTKEGQSGRVGLGLAICRQIVKSHHGEVAVRSEVGKGTTFSLFLPVERDRVLVESRP